MVYLKTTIDLNAGAAVSSMTNNSLSPPVAFNQKAKRGASTSVKNLEEKAGDLSQKLQDADTFMREEIKTIEKTIGATKSANSEIEELIKRLKPGMGAETLKAISATEAALAEAEAQLANLDMEKKALLDAIKENKNIRNELITGVQSSKYEQKKQKTIATYTTDFDKKEAQKKQLEQQQEKNKILIQDAERTVAKAVATAEDAKKEKDKVNRQQEEVSKKLSQF